MPRLLRPVRRAIQTTALTLFLYLFAAHLIYRTTQHLSPGLPADLFLRLDPLAAFSAMLAARSFALDLFLWALPVVVLTLLAGRIFCGWLCPLGTMIDVSDRLFFTTHRRKQAPSPMLLAARQWKYYILAAVAVSSALGVSLVYWLDPISLLTRSLTLSVLPALRLGLATLADHVGLPSWLAESRFISNPLNFGMGLVTLVMLVGVLSLGAMARRFWCRTLCPLGALLSLGSRYAPLRKYVDSGLCTRCLRCRPECDLGAVEQDPTHYHGYECIDCFGCAQVCPETAITLRPALAGGRAGRVDMTRRRLLTAGAFGLGWAAMAKTDLGVRRHGDVSGDLKMASAQLIRPPNARPEDEFAAACIRCSECMKVCPTNGLQPALAEAGLEGIWTPVLVPRIGPCTQECQLCGEVCPTRAIQPFRIADKPYIYLGTAMINRSTCLVWARDRRCQVCDEACSYNAIYWKTSDGIRRPYVDDYICVGCGLCESACPIQPEAAIRVYSLGDKRDKTLQERRVWQEVGEREMRKERREEERRPEG